MQVLYEVMKFHVIANFESRYFSELTKFCDLVYVQPWKNAVQWTIQLCQVQRDEKERENLKQFMKMTSIGRKSSHSVVNFIGFNGMVNVMSQIWSLGYGVSTWYASSSGIFLSRRYSNRF